MYGILYWKNDNGEKIPVNYLNKREVEMILSQQKREQVNHFQQINNGVETYGKLLDFLYKQRTLYLLVKGTEFLVKGY